mgnify:CR=1 FL=1
MDFSEKIKKYRETNKLTQDALAEKLNVSRQLVSKWETGNAYPSYDLLFTISELLGESIEELLSKKEIVTQTIQNKSTNKRTKIILISSIAFVALATGISVASIAIANKTRDAMIKQNLCSQGHSFGIYVSNNDATCDSYGTKIAVCNNCGAIKSIVDENQQLHSHNFYSDLVFGKNNEIIEMDIKCRDCSYLKKTTLNNTSIISYAEEKDGINKTTRFGFEIDRENNLTPYQSVSTYKCINNKEKMISKNGYYWSEKNTDWIEIYTQDYFYNGDGNLVSCEYNSWELMDPIRMPSSRHIEQYNDEGRCVYEEYYTEWSKELGKWIDGFKNEYIFDSNGKTISRKYYTISENSNGWEQTSGYEEIYNEEGKYIGYMSYSYNNEYKTYTKEYKTNQYDENDVCIGYDYSTWALIDGEFINVEKSEHRYLDDIGSDTSISYKYLIDTDEWVEDAKIVFVLTNDGHDYLYIERFVGENDEVQDPIEKEKPCKLLSLVNIFGTDKDGNEIQYFKELHDDNGTNWVSSFKSEYLYDESGEQIGYIEYEYDEENNRWVCEYNETTHDDKNKLVFSGQCKWIYVDNVWINSYKSESDYLGDNSIEYNWSIEDNAWIPTEKRDWSNDTCRMEYVWSKELNDWVNSKKTIYYSDEINSYNEKYVWDIEKETWIPSVKQEIPKGNALDYKQYNWSEELNEWVLDPTKGW